MLSWLLPFNVVTQPYVYIYPLPPDPPSSLCQTTYVRPPMSDPPMIQPMSDHPSMLSHVRLSSLCYTAASHQLSVLHVIIYLNATLSICPILSFPHRAHKSFLYVSISIPALQIGSSYVPFFQIAGTYIQWNIIQSQKGMHLSQFQ